VALGRAARRQGAVVRRVVLAVIVDVTLAQQSADDRERLLEAAHAMVVRKAERVVVGFVPAGPQAEDEPPVADLVDGRGHLGQHCRRVEARRGDERSDLYFLGRLSEAGERRPDFPRPDISGLAPIQQVVASPDGVESDPFRGLRHVAQLRPAHAALHLWQLDTDFEWSRHRAPSLSRHDDDGSGQCWIGRPQSSSPCAASRARNST
jgi:hypothetical protein